MLARYLFGTKSGRFRGDDIFTVDAFLEAMRKAHANHLHTARVLPACFDFDALFESCKHSTTDTGIQGWSVFEFRTDASRRGEVLLRTKVHMDDNGDAWIPWRQGTEDEGRFWPNASNAAMPGPEKPEIAELKDWKLDEVVDALQWFMDPAKQDAVDVSRATKTVLTDFIRSIPASAADIDSDPPWPPISPAQEPAVPAAPAVPERVPAAVPAAAPAAVPAAPGLTAAEKRKNLAVQRANDAFRELRKIAKGRLVVVLCEGNLEMGYTLSSVNLDIDETFEIRWWVNKDEAGKPKVDCNQPSDFLRGFQAHQDASFKHTLKVAEVTVFFAGEKKALFGKAKNASKILKSVKRNLSRIAGFPLEFSVNAGTWSSGITPKAA